jgi:methionyl-tRNA formyltransferase
MKIVFFGSGKIAVPSLEFLLKEKNEIFCVVTAPDKKSGRHLSLAHTSVKEFAMARKLNILQPENISDNDFLNYVQMLEADLFVVFSYGKILPKKLLCMPKCFSLNIHASLLPKYRGAAPINWALINGDDETGITIIKMNEKMDEGDIIARSKISITDFDTYATLEEKLSFLSVDSLSLALKLIEDNKIKVSKQNNSMASYAPKLKKDDGKIAWKIPACQIKNKIRGCFPWPGTFTYYDNKLIKIISAEVADTEYGDTFSPGEILRIDKNGIMVATGEKALLIKELQPSSGKILTAWQFIQGHKVDKNKVFK